MPTFQRRRDEALEWIRRGLDGRRMFVALSCGKDSAALLSLVRDVDPSIDSRILLWPESEALGNYADTIAAWRATGANVRELHLTRMSLDESVPERWARLRDLAPCDGHFVGLRAQESRNRRIALARHGILHCYRSGHSAGHWRCAPLAWWSVDDIAAQLYLSEAPLLDTYYAEGLEARTSTRLPRSEARDDAIAMLQRRGALTMRAARAFYPDDSI